MNATQHSPLGAYRAKRVAERTPEPTGVSVADHGGLFVLHKHAARRTHYDLRLELAGVLESWAVPKVPSRNPATKRLAIHVESHPLEYGDFEGVIPEGNYGAGAVIVWDRGRWIPIGAADEGLAQGKLLFELRGYKLRGRWTLVRTKGGEKQWLLIKEGGAAAPDVDVPFPETSVLSGLTVEQLGDGTDPNEPIRLELERLGAARRPVRAPAAKPMLAQARERPFSKPGWLFELKYDGYRIRAARTGQEVRLLTRNGADVTSTFPEVARALGALPCAHFLLDAELVVHDERGRPCFERLQQRAQLKRPLDVQRACVELPATLYLFDLLGFDGLDTRGLPLSERKRMLRRMLPAAGPLRYADHVEERGEELFAEVQRLGLEGIVAKRCDSRYRAGRSPSWLKVRCTPTGDFVVVGFTASRGAGGGLGALLLGAYDHGELRYAGSVGASLADAERARVHDRLAADVRATAACSGVPEHGGRGRPAARSWVVPRLVCEVRYRETTRSGLLRQPVLVRFRDDKPPEECERPAGHPAEPKTPEAPSAAPAPRAVEVRLTHRDKIYWPEQGFTKGDLLDYYRQVAPWMLPYLRDRPLVMTRFPDGISGKSFYQKDASGFAPAWLRRERVWSERSEREIDYFVADDEASLLYIANLGAIPIHAWASRVGTLSLPDWCILDLDPKGAPFAHVVRVARALHRLCQALGLPNYVKTSGSTGLHVLIPLGGQCTYEQSRTLGQLLACTVVAELPTIATVVRSVSQRQGRVYVDYLQNRHGQLLVAPYSVRPLPGAPVSTPLEWREVDGRLEIGRYTMRTVPARLARKARDPMRPVLAEKPDLVAALERLQPRVR